MMGHTHMAFGALLASGVAVASGRIEMTPAFLLAAEVGSLMPDLDQPRSMLSRRIPVSVITSQLFGHRHATHSLLALALVTLAAKLWLHRLTGWTGNEIALMTGTGFLHHYVALFLHWFSHFMGRGGWMGLGLGYASHLIADSFNPQGMWWFFPFKNRLIHLLGPLAIISTGSVGEAVFGLLVFAAVAYFQPTLFLIDASVVFTFWILMGKPSLPRWGD